MPDYIIEKRKLYIGGRDLSGDQTVMNLRFGRDAVEFTKGQDDTHVFKPGIRIVSFAAEGVVNLGPDLADEELFTKVNTLTDEPIIASPTTGLDGEPLYAFRANVGEYVPFAGVSIGDRLGFSVEARAHTGKLIRGLCMTDASVPRTSTVTGTARQFAGGVTSAQKLYAAIMVLAASGTTPTLDGKIQSDTVGFGSPTDVITFTQKTTAGQWQWSELAGPITDDYFRFVGTIGGGSPSFTIIVFLGVGPAT